MNDFISLFAIIAGYVIGLGAVTVIDLHGFLARKSLYWTTATIRTHKVTKPMIWIGIIAVLVGEGFYYHDNYTPLTLVQFMLGGILILNGLFLSFIVSPILLKKERDEKPLELLSREIQKRIQISFLVSFVGWWGKVGLFIFSLIR